MSEDVIKLLPRLLSFEHKCKQRKCNQMSEEFENMKKFIVYSNQLNVFYSNLINSEEFAIDDRDVFQRERQSLLFKIKTEVETITETVQQVFGDLNDSYIKNSLTVECHLCHKLFSSKRMSIHLTEHLNKIFGRKADNNSHDINKSLKQSKNKTRIKSNKTPEEYTQPLPSVEIKSQPIKEEPLFVDNSDNERNWSANVDGIDNDFSEDEEVLSKESIKTPKEKKKRNRKTNSSEKKSKRKIKKENKCINSCDLCQFKTIKNKVFQYHMTKEHNIDPEQATKYECKWPGCNRAFHYNTTLQRHIEYHQGALPYNCDWPGCNRVYRSQNQLVQHKWVHTGETPLMCQWPGCERKFRQNGNLQKHLLTHDKSKVKKHVCHYPECEKSFYNKRNLRQHIFSNHEQDKKPFRCSIEGCSASFVTDQNLRLHVSTIHSENRIRKARFECTHSDCKRYFFDPKRLERHMKRHERQQKKKDCPPEQQNGPKVYTSRTPLYIPCDWPGCDYIAKYGYSLKEHKKRAHIPEKPLKCDVLGCDYSAVRRYDLKVHMYKHTGEMPFPCDYPHCGRRFKSQRSLDTHITRNHSH